MSIGLPACESIAPVNGDHVELSGDLKEIPVLLRLHGRQRQANALLGIVDCFDLNDSR